MKHALLPGDQARPNRNTWLLLGTVNLTRPVSVAPISSEFLTASVFDVDSLGFPMSLATTSMAASAVAPSVRRRIRRWPRGQHR